MKSNVFNTCKRVYTHCAALKIHFFTIIYEEYERPTNLNLPILEQQKIKLHPLIFLKERLMMPKLKLLEIVL